MSTSSMLHARNNLSARHDIAESPILRWPEVCQAGHRTNRMHAGSAVFKTQSEAVVLLPGKQHEWKEAQEVRNGSRLCKNVFPPPKTARNRGRSASTRRSEDIFALSSPESTRAQARATLSDLNGHTMRITARTLHARIATRSGLMPTMFITRVRL